MRKKENLSQKEIKETNITFIVIIALLLVSGFILEMTPVGMGQTIAAVLIGSIMLSVLSVHLYRKAKYLQVRKQLR